MIRIGRHYTFESAHFLPNHEGKCKNMHGHQWEVEVTIEGYFIEDKNSPEYGMLMDFKKLDEIVNPLISRLDHKVLNDVMPYPTAELIAMDLGDSIEGFLPNRVKLVGVTVWETDNSYAEWLT
jgi:6-pyruvoyltetrahydropterin/6-carboxytetrahydropterin synthase